MSATRHLRDAAVAHLAAGRLAEAAAAYQELLARVPGDHDALHQLGSLRIQLGDSGEGHRLLSAAAAVDPGNAETWLHLGMAAQNLGRLDDAGGHYARALSLKPDYAAALFRQGVLLRHLGRRQDALAAFDRCALSAPNEDAVLQQRGEVKFELGDTEGAIADFTAVLAAKPDSVPALIYAGVARERQERFAEALALLDRAAVLAPGRAEIAFNRGVVLEALQRTDEALAAYDAAIGTNPGHADAWNNRGGVLRGRGLPEQAVQSFSRAIALAPDHLAALTNRGIVLSTMLGRHQEAAADFRRVLESQPDNSAALGGLATAALPLCDWDTIESLRPRLASKAVYGQGGVSPFTLSLILDDAKLLHDCAAAFIRKLVPLPSQPRPGLRPADGKIRLAYVSADFHTHATAHLIADLIERHDRERFEVIALSYGADDGKKERARLKRGFDRFIEAQDLTDAEAAALLRRLHTDIAIDLKGYTLWARPGIFAHGPAPVAVSWLGYPGTMAVDWYDYVLADAVVLPHNQQPCYDERIVHLPDCYQPNDPARPLAPMTRAAAGLPADGFVFCSFNIHRKISRDVFASWMRLLAAMPGSLLWLMDDSANDTLRRQAADRGIDPARLIFAPKLELDAHLGRIGAADLMLDTAPYGAHTTASDALWAGVPIVTVLGHSFANRVAASLVSAMGAPELIAASLEDYEKLALELAQSPARLTALKAKLAANRHTAPLFDAARFCRHIEAAYEQMIGCARAGEAPRPFDIPVMP